MTENTSSEVEVGGYVRKPDYHWMRLRMLLTGNNAPGDAVLRDALIRLNERLEKEPALLRELQGYRQLRYRVFIAPREDGGVRVHSHELPGLHLSGEDRGKVYEMVPEAIRTLLVKNEGISEDEIESVGTYYSQDIPYLLNCTVILKPLPAVN